MLWAGAGITPDLRRADDWTMVLPDTFELAEGPVCAK
jgi:hypothetical protein